MKKEAEVSAADLSIGCDKAWDFLETLRLQKEIERKFSTQREIDSFYLEILVEKLLKKAKKSYETDQMWEKDEEQRFIQDLVEEYGLRKLEELQQTLDFQQDLEFYRHLKQSK